MSSSNSVNARDVTLRFAFDAEDSFKCPSTCCVSFNSGNKTKTNSPIEVSVSASGIVDRFNSKSIQERTESMQSTLSNLEARVRSMARQVGKDEDEAIGKILRNVIDPNQILTLDKAQKINSLILSYMRTPEGDEVKVDG